ncbi:MAG TPA: hypothetical protein DCS93_37830 [Microscillaceae bacterium]|nr:hypothetical protein [Microscillaceae bacterium]
MKENRIRTLDIIWLALMGGQVVFLMVTLLVLKGDMAQENLQGMIDVVAVAFLVPSLLMSQILFKKFIQQIKDSEVALPEKLNRYQTATLIKGALIEAGNLFCIIALMLTDSQWLVIPIVAVLGFFFLQRPSVNKFEAALEQ